jgi:hypothetical protein
VDALGRRNHTHSILGLNPKIGGHLIDPSRLLVNVHVVPVLTHEVDLHSDSRPTLPILNLTLAFRILVEPLACPYRQPA